MSANSSTSVRGRPLSNEALATEPPAASVAPLLTLENVKFSYDEQSPIFDGLDLALAPGQITSIVGPSGCGKTTLLSLVSGLEEPTDGNIVWSDVGQDDGRHPLAMMFQKDTVLPWLTVRDNVGLHYRMMRSKLSKEQQAERIDQLLEVAGLKDAEHLYPYQLSGGMRRRTAFLASVAPRPRILLLDEPFSALDEPTRIAIHQDIFEIVKREDITVLLITHDIGEAVSLADEVKVFSRAPAQVVDTYEVPFSETRNMMHLRETEEFLHIYGHVWETLSRQISRTPSRESR